MKRPPIALVAMLTVVGFLMVVAGNATSVASESQAPRRQALVNQVLAERRNVDDLDKAVQEVRSQVDAAQARAGQLSSAQASDNAAEEALALAAGTTAVSGPGLVVKLSDAPIEKGEDRTRFDGSRVQDSDLQLVVNALFASGAEAVAINDNRVVAVTPIRAAGGTIVVNYRPVNSPYRVVAIGADKDRFAATEIASNMRQWNKRYNLGYELDTSRKLTAPAYSGRVGIEIAQTGAS